MLLGFYDRNNNGLAVELSPEMAKAIASRVREFFEVANTTTIFDDTSALQLARFAFEEIYLTSLVSADEELCRTTSTGSVGINEFSRLLSGVDEVSEYESTGAFIDFQNGEECVFWEYYDRNGRYSTPYLSLAQLDAIANNQPLPQE